MQEAIHFIYVVDSEEAEQWDVLGYVPQWLEIKTADFDDLLSGDVLWMLRFVSQRRNVDLPLDTQIVGRFLVAEAMPCSFGRTTIMSKTRTPLQRMSLAAAKLMLGFTRPKGNHAELIDCPTSRVAVTVKDERRSVVRTGWQLDPETVGQLEKRWAALSVRPWPANKLSNPAAKKLAKRSSSAQRHSAASRKNR